MDLGMFMMPAHPPERPLREAHARDLQILRDADRLGFREVWIGEHFTQPWEPICAPDLLIAQALMETEQIVLAPGAHILPYHHPAELAHRIAYLDHIAGGRLMVGIGSGGTPTDWTLFDIDGAGGQGRRMMWEGLEIMLRLWEQSEPFTYEGEYWTVHQPAAILDGGMAPHIKCLQDPHPAIGTAGLSPSSATLREAGRRGLIPLSLGLSSRYLAGHWAAIAEGAQEGGHEPDPAQWRVGREVLVAETDAEARRLALDGLMGRMAGEFLIKSYTSFGFLEFAKADPADPDEAVTPEYLLDRGWLVGSPDTVVEKIEALVDRIGPFGTLLINSYDYGDDADAWTRSMTLLAEEVFPRVADLTPSPSRAPALRVA
jgi:alkanesulfonate monooxygenase SsuD/methylene tetrahydromethanopterin reductase-like flavin-dependent oxidoreductase (luciferase family)